jgi:hypothetical protein
MDIQKAIEDALEIASSPTEYAVICAAAWGLAEYSKDFDLEPPFDKRPTWFRILDDMFLQILAEQDPSAAYFKLGRLEGLLKNAREFDRKKAEKENTIASSTRRRFTCPRCGRWVEAHVNSDDHSATCPACENSVTVTG